MTSPRRGRLITAVSSLAAADGLRRTMSQRLVAVRAKDRGIGRARCEFERGAMFALTDLKESRSVEFEEGRLGVKLGSDACAPKWRQGGSQRTLARPDQSPSSPNSIATQRLDQTRFSCRRELREHGEITAASRRDLQRSVHVDPDHVAARREPELTLAGEQHVPGLMLLMGDEGVLAVGAEPAAGPGPPWAQGSPSLFAGPAVFGPSARLKMPAAEGPKAFFAAFSNTWRSVNSWKNRSPTG